MLASWADAIDNTHDDTVDVTAALVDSDEVSSAKASSDSCSDSDAEAAAFLADADFAVAVARAAELSGLTVVGSTVTDPNTQREKGRSDNTLHCEAEKRNQFPFVCIFSALTLLVGWQKGHPAAEPTASKLTVQVLEDIVINCTRVICRLTCTDIFSQTVFVISGMRYGAQ